MTNEEFKDRVLAEVDKCADAMRLASNYEVEAQLPRLRTNIEVIFDEYMKDDE